MIEIVPAPAGDALEDFLTLAQEYVTWMTAQICVQYPALDLPEFTAEHSYDDLRRKFPGEHVAPHGGLLLARHDGAARGCIAVGRLTGDICEVRTLFVRPQARGLGAGRRLAEAALAEARTLGYRAARLDTLGFMAGAQALYRSLGFHDIPPYLDMSPALVQYIRFMECDLTP